MIHEKVVGILGGMGPLATVDFMRKIIEATHARTEQDNIRLLIDCNPKVPPRVEAILHDGADPGLPMADMAKNLESAGADLLVIACNTAHYYYEVVSNAVHIPVLDLLKTTAQFLGGKKVPSAMILGTEALLRTNLYGLALEKEGVKAILPDVSCQSALSSAIAAVKTGHLDLAHTYAEQIARHCKESGAAIAILGCTELPIAFQGVRCPVPLLDPGLIAAEEIVRLVKGP